MRSALRAGVLVQGSAHGLDNSAMLDALERRPDRLRGVAVADENVAPRYCANGTGLACAACASIISSAAGSSLSRRRAAHRRRDQLWIDVKDLPDTILIFKKIGLLVVIDHMDRTDARAGTARRAFRASRAPWAKAGAGQSSPARIGSATEPRIIRTRGRFTRRW